MKPFLVLMLLISIPAFAGSNLQLSGFGTLGTLFTESDTYGYRGDFSQVDGVYKDDIDLSATSILGGQASYLVNNSLDFVYQAVYRDQENATFDRLTDLAFIRYSPTPGWSLRFGRTTYDIYLLSEYREVGFAYTWAHIPVETYGIVPYRHLDGADVTYTRQFKHFTLDTKFFTGKTKANLVGFLNEPQEQVNLENIYGIGLDFEALHWVIKLKYTEVTIANAGTNNDLIINGLSSAAAMPGFDSIWPNALEFAESLRIGDTGATYSSISGRYDLEEWSFLSEFSTVDSETLIIPLLKSFYISVIHHMGRHSVYGTYATTDKTPLDLSSQNVNLEVLAVVPQGLDLYNGIQALLDAVGADQSTFSLGWRWDFSDRIALKVQWDYVQIKEEGSTLFLRQREGLNNLAEDFSTLFTSVSFTF